VKVLHLNLAARPYRDYRAFNAVVVVVSLLIAVIAWADIDTVLRYRQETTSTRAKIAQLQRQTAEEQKRADAANQRIRSIDTRRLGSQAQFANARLAERAFSWSELLDRLEHVLPDDVRITSISPAFDKSGLIHLTLSCEGKAGDSLVRTLNRFYGDRQHFTNPFPAMEEHTTDLYRFNISVDYRPSIARPVE
jgi:Tfp pilus assembly protein PilN